MSTRAHRPSPPPEIPLQTRLDEITAQTRSLVQPERLAVTDTFVAELLAAGLEERILQPGADAPAFTLTDAVTGKRVRSADLLALGPLIVTFFRGRWCPYCMTELQAWQAAFPQVRARGALLVGISPQLQRQNDFTAQQHEIAFPLLSDPHADVAEQFGLVYAVPEPMQQHFRSILVNIPFINGDGSWRIPLPGTFVIDQRGKVLYARAFADHRTRPDPAEVLDALSADAPQLY